VGGDTGDSKCHPHHADEHGSEREGFIYSAHALGHEGGPQDDRWRYDDDQTTKSAVKQ
jgi:hypothetical protein